MTDEVPAAGRRVRQTAPEYRGTNVYHSLYLPVDWQPGRTYPMIVEYTGNHYPACGSTGEVKDANLGYGISGGRGFIWVAMPYIEKDHRKNAITWWGDTDATVNYCKTNLPRVCAEFGGNAGAVLFCGFSRGAIAAGYIGMADDEIAALWTAVMTHDHFDGERTWPYPDSDRQSALARLGRLNGRPVLICGLAASSTRDDFLKNHLDLAQFSFLDVPVAELFDIPEGRIIHPHTDLWMCRDSPQRRTVRQWIDAALNLQ